MSLDAEQILAMTGLLPPWQHPAGAPWPDASAVNGSRTILEDLKKQLLGALDRDSPARVRVKKTTDAYFERLAKDPSYPDMVADLDDYVGLEIAMQWQTAHMNAREVLMSRHPTINVESVSGIRIFPPDPVAQTRFLFEADVVENQRIALDLQAAALNDGFVQVFQAAFPLMYGQMFKALQTELNNRAARNWYPPFWLDRAVRIFLQAPAKGAIDLHAPPPPPPKNARGAINVKALAVPGTEVPK